MVIGDRLDASIGLPLAVRVNDPHPPSTFRHQLLTLCANQNFSCALFIINEKTVLLVVRKEKLVLVDSHLHGHNGAMVILSKTSNADDFVNAVQESLGFNKDTFGNLVHVSF